MSPPAAAHEAPTATPPHPLRAWAEELVARAREEGVELTGDGGLLTDLVRQVLQTGLEVEPAEHLGYEPYDPAGRGSGNSRNGSYPKTITTEIGEVEVAMPRDRNGTFAPVTVPKHVRRLDGLAGNVISLYAKALTTSRPTVRDVRHRDQQGDDLEDHRRDRRGHARLAEPAARSALSGVVDRRDHDQGQRRPGRESAVYVTIGVNLDVDRDVLGLWLGPTGGEGAKRWMTMLTELRNRGIQDALIVCCDGLKGLPDAVRVTWPEAIVQTCVVHMVRNSLRYASKKHWSAITKQIRAIYTAPTVEAAEAHFSNFADTWRDLYPAMISSWENAWSEFVPFVSFPVELRKASEVTTAIGASLPAAVGRRRGT